MASTDLKEQFLLLQAQQQQKLLERRKNKAEAKKNNADNKKEFSGTFKANDDLNLKADDKPIGSTSYISEELVDHLNNEIRQMKDENGRLFKLLSEKDFEIRQLKKKIEDNKNVLADGGITNETVATKIIELSKKIRHLTAEKETEKTRCKQLQKNLYDLQLQMQSLPPPATTSSLTGSVISLRSNIENKDDESVDVKALQERLKQSESRAADFRNQCQSLRQELKIAHKVLSQEIGENVNFQALLNETSNWRGRSQQITVLQQKVEELKAQLDGSPGDGNANSDKASALRKKQEERYREELRKMEKERKEAQEITATKLKILEAENQSINEKLDAAKARNKVLSNEIKSQKAQVHTLLKKSRNDDEFIDALMKQQAQMKQMLEDHNLQQTKQQHQQQQQLLQMSVKSQQDSNVVEQLKAIAAEKEAQVHMLEMELQHLKMVHKQSHQTSNGFDPPQELASGHAMALVSSTDNRPHTSSILDTQASSQADLVNSALNTSRSRSASRLSNRPGSVTRDLITSQPYQLQLSSLTYQLKEMEVMARATEVEKDKMAELVQVLQGRLAEETQRLTSAEAEILAQKRQLVEMEKKIARHNLEVNKRKGTSSKVNNSAREKPADDSFDGSHADKNELLARLEIQKDENESLKVALQRTFKSKEEDLKVYSSTLEETKKVFLQALRQIKEKQVSS